MTGKISSAILLRGLVTILVNLAAGFVILSRQQLDGLWVPFGTVAVIFGWKECLLMFALNFGLLYWYSRAH